MLIYNVHKSTIVMNSLDTRFSRNVFEAVQKTRSTCFIGSKPLGTTGLKVSDQLVANATGGFKSDNTAARVLNITLTVYDSVPRTNIYLLKIDSLDNAVVEF